MELSFSNKTKTKIVYPQLVMYTPNYTNSQHIINMFRPSVSSSFLNNILCTVTMTKTALIFYTHYYSRYRVEIHFVFIVEG